MQNKYKCPKCKLEFNSKIRYRKHLQNSHNNMCEYCLESFRNPHSLGSHKSRCRKNPNYKKNIKNIKDSASRTHKGHRHTEKEKEHLSRKLREYYILHPDLVPYKKNHHHLKESYPERYFKKVFHIEKFPEYKQDFYFKGYFLDIAYPSVKIDIEINGSQHYVDDRIVKHDIKRKSVLESYGWKCYPINWSRYLKLSRKNKRQFISGLKHKILSQMSSL